MNFKKLSIIGGVLSKNVELVKILIENGAKKDVKEQSGKTPRDYAIQSKNEEILKLFK
jgi:ankyrin repeat protein